MPTCMRSFPLPMSQPTEKFISTGRLCVYLYALAHPILDPSPRRNGRFVV